MTFSHRLGEDLQAMFDLPDHRGDTYYASYDNCAAQWYERYPAFESSGLKGDTP